MQELLFDTGIGKEGYSIIGQGQIDKILSGKPEERRELFDEAAGIVKFKKRKAAAEKNLEEERQNLVRIEDILSELDKQVGPLQEQSEKAREYLGCRDELRNLDINLFLAEYDDIHKQIVEVEGKQEIAARDLEEAGKEFDKTKEEYLAAQKQLEDLDQALEKKKEALSMDKLSLNQSEGEIKVLEEQINTVTQNKSHAEEQIHSLQERIEEAGKERENYLEQKEEADKKAAALAEEQAADEEDISRLQAQMGSMEAEISQCSQNMLACLNENADVRSDQQRLQTLLEQNNIKKAEINKRLLENKTEAAAFEETLENEKKALAEITDDIRADIVRVKKEYEVAVETALGGSIQNIVTDNEQTAKGMIAFLKKNRYGRATFLPLTNIKAKPVRLSGNVMNEAGVIGMASTLVEAEDRFSNLVEYLLGRFVVVDTIDNAISLAGKYHHTLRIVTTEGELLNPGGSMSGGAFKNSQNLLGRRREMEDLKKRSGELKGKLKELSEDIAENEKESSEAAKKISAGRKIRQELSLKQNTAKLNYDRAAEDMEKNQEKLQLIRMESSQLAERENSLKQDIGQINEKVLSNERLSKESERRMEELSAALEQLKEEHGRQSKEQADRLLEITAHNQSSQFIQENLNRIHDTAAGLQQELEQMLKSGREADLQVAEKQGEIERAKEQIVSLQKQIEELSGKIERDTKEKEELNIRHKGFFEKREELSAKKSELDKECFRLDSQKEKLVERIDSYTNYMWEQYELTYHTAEEKKTEVPYSLSQIRSEISKLKSRMKALGDVNVNAIEQYQEVQERYDLLHTQHDDLIEAANVLMGIIEELDTEMRRQFEEQFEEIRTRFDNVFKELFGGGRGTLELTEEDDILTAGIRIVAQPPGKKLQNMMQLSGGEKALTAIALLFAIQSLKPSPFCLLDEIEAALDDSNVSRYAEYLHKLTKDTQFIVITHRRGTMNAADILYGITMQEKGVSTLVSVSLLDEKEIAN